MNRCNVTTIHSRPIPLFAILWLTCVNLQKVSSLLLQWNYHVRAPHQSTNLLRHPQQLASSLGNFPFVPEDLARERIEAHQREIDRLNARLSTGTYATRYPTNDLNVPGSSFPPLKVMIFVDGTWLYYALYERDVWRDPIQRRFGQHWKWSRKIDWKQLPRIVSQALQDQEKDRGWTQPLSSGDTSPMPSRPIEVVRVSVYTSIRPGTPQNTRRHKMFQEMAKAKFDVTMFDTVGKSEKCIDIQLAVDMLHFATTPNAFDVAVLLTGDKDYIPAMVRCRQKGRRVALVTTKNNCAPSLFEMPNIKDYDAIWLDDHIDELLTTKEYVAVAPGKAKLSLSALNKIISDYISKSGMSTVALKDIKHYIETVSIGDRRVSDEIREVHGDLLRFLRQSLTFKVDKLAESADFYVSLVETKADGITDTNKETAGLSFQEQNFFNSLSSYDPQDKHYPTSLGTLMNKTLPETSAPSTFDYSVYTVQRLKEICREHSLPVSGRKSELIARIENAVATEQDAATEQDEPTPVVENTVIDSKEYLEGLVLHYLDMKGGKASSRDVGRYLTQAKPSAIESFPGESALGELKKTYGSLSMFISKSGKLRLRGRTVLKHNLP